MPGRVGRPADAQRTLTEGRNSGSDDTISSRCGRTQVGAVHFPDWSPGRGKITVETALVVVGPNVADASRRGRRHLDGDRRPAVHSDRPARLIPGRQWHRPGQVAVL